MRCQGSNPGQLLIRQEPNPLYNLSSPGLASLCPSYKPISAVPMVTLEAESPHSFCACGQKSDWNIQVHKGLGTRLSAWLVLGCHLLISMALKLNNNSGCRNRELQKTHGCSYLPIGLDLTHWPRVWPGTGKLQGSPGTLTCS